MRNVAVLSHIGDIDGVGSAALVRMKYKIPVRNLFFSGHGAEEVSNSEREIRRLYKEGLLLFITDLTPGPKTVHLYEKVVKSVNANGGKVVIFDHHSWYPEIVEKVAKKSFIAVFGENKKMCATELTQKYLDLNGKFVTEFTHLVHHADFYIQLAEKKHSKLVDDYSMAIGYTNMSRSYPKRMRELRHMAGVISSGRFTDGKIKQFAQKFRKLNQERIREMISNLYKISDEIAVGFTKQVDSTEACMSVIRTARVGISVVVNLDHMKGSIRSRITDVVELAKSFKGGGHPHAAGFNIDAKRYNFFRNKRDRLAFVKDVEKHAQMCNIL